MPTRRSHQKSRAGCTTCKLRHVKCDEKGPPCGSCKARGTDCDYASPNSILQISPPNNSTSLSTATNYGAKADEPVFQTNQRLLELQLMARWCSVTHKSLVSEIAEDHIIWSTRIPMWSLQYDFLLNGIFALTAFEIASSYDMDRALYITAAEEYQGLALRSFRQHLTQVSDDSFEPVLCFSLMLMILALASAQFHSTPTYNGHESMVQKTFVHFELLRGCILVLDGKDQYVKENPHFQKLTLIEDLPEVPLDSRTEAALAKLGEANERRIISSIGDTYESRLKQVSYWKACKNAINELRLNFSKCLNDDYQGYVLGFLNVSGDDYVDAIKTEDSTALLILMYWGALVETLSHRVWWARDFGRSLVKEISGRYEPDTTDSLTEEIISLVKELVESAGQKQGKS